MSDWSNIGKKSAEILKRYRYPLLILLIGVVLVMIPTGHAEEPEALQTISEEGAPTLEEKLETVLSGVDGAGRVRVILSIAESEAAVYQTDVEISSGAETETRRESTVFYQSASSEEVPAVIKTIGVQYRGALVVAEGGDIPSVQLSLVNAVAGLTGLGADNITVIKMKES